MTEIYYLLDFHKKCVQVIKYSDKIIDDYCNYINKRLEENFTVQEQKQLKLFGFDKEQLYNFAYYDVENITFDNLDKNKLFKLFNDVSFVDLDDLDDLDNLS